MNSAIPVGDEEFRSASVPDLAHHPDVNIFLTGLGFGPFEAEGLRSVFARSPNWAGRTEGGQKVFVKKIAGSRAEVESRIRRTAAHQNVVSALGKDPLAGPPCLGWDLESGLVVFEYLEDSVSGSGLVEKDEFTPEVGEHLGRAVGRLHRMDTGAAEMDTSPLSLPSVRQLEGLTEAEYESSSQAMRQIWRLLQEDRDLFGGVRELLELEGSAPRTACHCDLRVDQILVAGGHLHLTDWEEFRMADPARDVGSYAGEWFYRAALEMSQFPREGDPARAAVGVGALALERLRPQVVSFWEGYCHSRPDIDSQLPVRATAFAGWHLLARVLSGAMRWSRLPAKHLAAAGVGRRALLRPQAFAATLGFET